MTKTIAFSLVAAATLGLAACSTPEEPANDAVNAAEDAAFAAENAADAAANAADDLANAAGDLADNVANAQ